VKTDFAKESADHRELRAVVGIEQAAGEVAALTRAAACTSSSSHLCGFFPFAVLHAANQGEVVVKAQLTIIAAIISSAIVASETPASAMES
jgi:hypothetical protein